MGALWHMPNMEICKLDGCVYMGAHIFNNRVLSGPKCCFGVVRLVLSIHDNFGDEDGILLRFSITRGL